MKANGELPEYPICSPGDSAENFVTDCVGKVCKGFGCCGAFPAEEYDPVTDFGGAAGSEVHHDLVHGDGSHLRETLAVRSHPGSFAGESSRIAICVAGCNGGYGCCGGCLQVRQ